jgi:hypothetical protein
MSSTQEKNEQASSPQIATFEELFAKPKRTSEFQITLADADGKPAKRTMVYKAISATEYDDLVTQNPPTAKQLQESPAGVAFNINTFAPALISAVSHQPKLTYAQAEQLYNAPDWSGGEVSTLFYNAQRVCNQGLDVPFNERG